jgi:mannose-1-phosphate guanylyltransferase/phosphomannomutase
MPADARLKVVAEMAFGMASVVLPQVAAGWGIDLISLRPILDAERTLTSSQQNEPDEETSLAVSTFRADFGVRIDAAGERVVLISPDGTGLDGDTALHALVELWCGNPQAHGDVAVPVMASHVVERIAQAHGRCVIRTGSSKRALSLAALRNDIGFAGDRAGGFVFPAFLAAFDAVMTVGSLARLLTETGRRLDEVVAALPKAHLVEASVGCPSSAKGAVMRAMSEATAGLETQMTDGIGVKRDGGWALVLPDPAEPLVHVFAEGEDVESAHALLSEYTRLVEEAAAPR